MSREKLIIMERGVGNLATREEEYIINNLRDYKIIGRLTGGSSAELYIIENLKNHNSYVIKICAKEGVENGKKKLAGEIEYLKNTNISSRGFFAEVIDLYSKDDIVWYIMPYYQDKKTIYELICEDIPVKNDIYIIFSDLFNNLFTQNLSEAMSDFVIKRHFDRVYARMKECGMNDERFEKLIHQKTIIVNGRELYNYGYIMQKIRNDSSLMKKISPPIASLTHDDLTIENVMVGGDNYILIDPRGTSDTGHYRDYIYDIAKFTNTLSGFTTVKYDQFVAWQEDNSITYKLNETVQKKYDAYYDYVFDCVKEFVERQFPEDIYWRERLIFSEACHYLADIACRMYNGDKYEKLIALYARGLESINSFWNSYTQNNVVTIPEIEEAEYLNNTINNKCSLRILIDHAG